MQFIKHMNARMELYRQLFQEYVRMTPTIIVRLHGMTEELLFNRRPFGEGQTQDAFRRQTAVEGTFDIVSRPGLPNQRRGKFRRYW